LSSTAGLRQGERPAELGHRRSSAGLSDLPSQLHTGTARAISRLCLLKGHPSLGPLTDIIGTLALAAGSERKLSLAQ
jgi:hypothetical protein